MIKLRAIKDKKTRSTDLQVILPDGTIVEGGYSKIVIEKDNLEAEFNEWACEDDAEWLVDFYLDEKENIPVLIIEETGFHRWKIPMFHHKFSTGRLEIKIKRKDTESN